MGLLAPKAIDVSSGGAMNYSDECMHNDINKSTKTKKKICSSLCYANEYYNQFVYDKQKLGSWCSS